MEETVKNLLLEKFIAKIPPEEKAILNRLLYHVVQAYWYTLRHYTLFTEGRRGEDAHGTFKFANWLLGKDMVTYQQVKDFYYGYLYRLPVCGAVIFNAAKTHWLTVRSKHALRIGFAKGKKEQNESDVECAIREVKEETGLDIRPYINESRYVEVTAKHKRVKFYVIDTMPDFPISNCRPQDPDEIAECAWTSRNELRKNYTRESQAVLRYLRDV